MNSALQDILTQFWHKANNFNILFRGGSNVEAVPTSLEFDAWFEKYRYNFLNTS